MTSQVLPTAAHCVDECGSKASMPDSSRCQDNAVCAVGVCLQTNVLDASVVEQVVGVVVADNLDLGCVVIERAATDKVRCNREGCLRVGIQTVHCAQG